MSSTVMLPMMNSNGGVSRFEIFGLVSFTCEIPNGDTVALSKPTFRQESLTGTWNLGVMIRFYRVGGDVDHGPGMVVSFVELLAYLFGEPNSRDMLL